MEILKKNFLAIAVLCVLLFSAFSNMISRAGDPIPPEPPGPTMHTLEEIYDASISDSSGVSQREGFHKFITLAEDSVEELLTVEPGKRLVLLKLYAPLQTADAYQWRLTVNDIEFIDGTITKYGGEYSSGGWTNTYKYEHNFPDRCVVVDAGETLKVVNYHPTNALWMTLIGYYYDVP
jgi:hypothetical protein